MNEVVRGRARRVGAPLLLLLGIPMVAAAWSCGDDPVVDGVDGSPDVKGDAKDTGADAPPVTCPSGKEPKDDPTCVTSDLGIFVSAAGNDGDPGTKEKPVATLGAALTKAGSGGKGKIFVCEGSYTESVTITSTIGVYGGFKCSDWSYSGTKPKFAGAKPDFVVKIDGATVVTIADLELDGKDGAPNSGESSIGLLVSNSANVLIVRMAVSAGLGSKGTDGILAPYTFPLQSDLNGSNADGSNGGTGGKAVVIACPDGQKTTGGKGADITNKNGDPGLPALGEGAGGTAVACLGTSGGGGKGAPGPAATVAPASTALGKLTQTWQPLAGSDGASGSPGQGGGGSGSTTGAGGGGGAGGCGGAGGTGGRGGGASIAVVSIASSTKLVGSTITSKNAGAAGAGAGGQIGQAIFGFGGTPTPGGCLGGAGGIGGAGGAGAGGAGGVSFGVLYKGTKPDLDGPTSGAISVGQKGPKGLGAGGNDGLEGISQPMFECALPLCL